MSAVRAADGTTPGTGSMGDRTVLITGGTGGIGRATAIRLASMGARVGITGRDVGRAQRAAAEIASTARIMPSSINGHMVNNANATVIQRPRTKASFTSPMPMPRG